MAFLPVNPNYEQKVRSSFSGQRALPFIGATLARVAPGEVDIALDHRDELTQQLGALHGAFVAAIGDSAIGYAALTLMGADSESVSVELKINFLRPAIGTSFVSRGRVIKPGRALTVCQADIFAIDEGREQLIAVVQGTLMQVAQAPTTVEKGASASL